MGDAFSIAKEDDVISIQIRKERKSDHQYIIIMLRGGENIKIHYGSSGGLFEQNREIADKFGILVENIGVPSGLKGDQVIRIFELTKEKIEVKFDGGNCGRLANEFVSKIGGTSIENPFM